MGFNFGAMAGGIADGYTKGKDLAMRQQEADRRQQEFDNQTAATAAVAEANKNAQLGATTGVTTPGTDAIPAQAAQAAQPAGLPLDSSKMGLGNAPISPYPDYLGAPGSGVAIPAPQTGLGTGSSVPIVPPTQAEQQQQANQISSRDAMPAIAAKDAVPAVAASTKYTLGDQTQATPFSQGLIHQQNSQDAIDALYKLGTPQATLMATQMSTGLQSQIQLKNAQQEQQLQTDSAPFARALSENEPGSQKYNEARAGYLDTATKAVGSFKAAQMLGSLEKTNGDNYTQTKAVLADGYSKAAATGNPQALVDFMNTHENANTPYLTSMGADGHSLVHTLKPQFVTANADGTPGDNPPIQSMKWSDDPSKGATFSEAAQSLGPAFATQMTLENRKHLNSMDEHNVDNATRKEIAAGSNTTTIAAAGIQANAAIHSSDNMLSLYTQGLKGNGGPTEIATYRGADGVPRQANVIRSAPGAPPMMFENGSAIPIPVPLGATFSKLGATAAATPVTSDDVNKLIGSGSFNRKQGETDDTYRARAVKQVQKEQGNTGAGDFDLDSALKNLGKGGGGNSGANVPPPKVVVPPPKIALSNTRGGAGLGNIVHAAPTRGYPQGAYSVTGLTGQFITEAAARAAISGQK